MTSKKQARRALVASFTSLLLCFAMLIGTTFAWFTDVAETGLNQIIAGNLDVELWDTADNNIESDTDLFTKPELWEPGAVAYTQFTVVNSGNLNLKYNISVNHEDVNDVDGHVLSEALSYAIFTEPFTLTGDETADRAAILKAVEENPTSMIDLDANKGIYGELLAPDAGSSVRESDVYTVVVYWAPSANDNDYNVNNTKQTSDGNALQINLGIKVAATQLEGELDSFGPNYDENAPLPWTGLAVTDAEFAEKVDTAAQTIAIHTPQELAYWAANANNYRGYTINILANIDLAGANWVPADLWSTEKALPSINGNGYTISNMTVAGGSKAAFISNLAGTGAMTISDLTFDNASIIGSSYVATVIGYQYGKVTLSNVAVTNSTVETTASAGIGIGGLVGFSVQNDGATLAVDGCSVTDNVIVGYHSTGAVVGVTKSDDASKFSVSNTTVTGNGLYYTATGGIGAHEIGAGSAGYTPASYTGAGNTIQNNTVAPLSQKLGADLNAALAAAQPGDTVTLEAADYDVLTISQNLEDITIVAPEGAKLDTLVVAGTLKDVTLSGFEGAGVGTGYADAFIKVAAGATNTNLIVEDCVFEKSSGTYTTAISNAEPTASITVKHCTFDATRAFWSTISFSNLTFEDCTFQNIANWVIQHNATPYDANLTVNNCTFTNCTDGIMKLNSNNNGYITAGHTFTFTNNTITNCKGHDQSDAKWFAVNTITNGATAVWSNNTKDGAVWTPDASNGLYIA